MARVRSNTPLRLRQPPDTRAHSESTGSSPLSGNLEVVPIFDVLQWVCVSRQSWQVHLLEREVDAYVAVVDGELADARWGNQVGHEALISILDTKVGRFELRPISGETHRTLRGGWVLTLLTATQKADERGSRPQEPPTNEANTVDVRLKIPNESGEHTLGMPTSTPTQPQEPPPTSNSVAPETSTEPSPQSMHLMDLGFAAMKSGDLEQARQLWTRALEHDPSNRALQFNLRKLDSLPPPSK